MTVRSKRKVVPTAPVVQAEEVVEAVQVTAPSLSLMAAYLRRRVKANGVGKTLSLPVDVVLDLARGLEAKAAKWKATPDEVRP